MEKLNYHYLLSKKDFKNTDKAKIINAYTRKNKVFIENNLLDELIYFQKILS